MVDTHFDPQLMGIPHFALHPNYLPWVGPSYRNAELKILLLGESHYLPEGVSYHHDADAWYSGMRVTESDLKWITTRSVIRNGLRTKWKGRSKTIFRNLSAALRLSGFSQEEDPFASVAFMNFFQRPAEVTGESIQVKEIDRQISSATVASVVSCLQPDLVFFCSALASKNRTDGLIQALKSSGCDVGYTCHPAIAWWNRPSRKRNGLTGSEVFCDAVKKSLDATRQTF